ncbi:hypothetical protein DKP76_18270 [Falsochrobactrum shanghaiense]|uniref:Uncharacterized protein n=1 Tax=Falsochrobactrum shanghaiense TaxID=2201899 RepID=A0A316J2Z3_9HYPH|nr:class I SAM-dependent methyltransferase [Falsochrobactrum shanghaiense]PWL16282.1 hypothetical protein DKP76_18270 [Falsochrobactrum shanghaiense]
MITWLTRGSRDALNKLLQRQTIHGTSVDVKALGDKVDLLLSAGKVNEASIQAVRQSLDALSCQIDMQQEALETAVIKSGDAFQARMTTFVRKIEALERMSFRQHEALATLTRVLNTRHPFPTTRGWAASPDLLLFLYEFVLEKKPTVVVELGGGLSSLVIAAALKTNGQGRLFSFDHDAEYAARTTTLLEREGFSDVAVIKYAPLSQWLPPTPSSLAVSWEWYTLPENLPAIDLLMVDGPPENTGSYSRYPALPALTDKLAPNATVLLDDTIREAETKIAETWRDEFGFDLVLRRDFEKGLAILGKLGATHKAELASAV